MAVYEGKVLEVNLTNGAVTSSTVDKGNLRKFIGGSGLAAKLFSTAIWLMLSHYPIKTYCF